MKGSIIQLANGELKRVEDLKTDDFINCADISADLKIDSSTVVRIKEDEGRNTAILSFSVGEQRIQVCMVSYESRIQVCITVWCDTNPVFRCVWGDTNPVFSMFRFVLVWCDMNLVFRFVWCSLYG